MHSISSGTRSRSVRSTAAAPVVLAFGLLLASSASFAQQAEPSAATQAVGSLPADQAPAPSSALPELPPTSQSEHSEPPLATASLAHDLSPWGMYQAADRVVKGVMLLLMLASVATWTIWIAKTVELVRARRRLRQDLAAFKGARTLRQAAEQLDADRLGAQLAEEAREELELSSNHREKEGIKERVALRLDRLVAASGRSMSQGTGLLATIGSVAPFVGLFGTVWGIMNSFIGIAKSQTTNLAVVAPGIAEALLATAIGLVAAIPAVVIYNVFARSITAYKAQVVDASTQVLILVGRDLDHPTAFGETRAQAPHMVKVG